MELKSQNHKPTQNDYRDMAAKEREASELADNLIRQSKASALAAETINKAKASAQKQLPVNNPSGAQSPELNHHNNQPSSLRPTTDEIFKSSAYKDKLLSTANQNQPFKKTEPEPKTQTQTQRQKRSALKNLKQRASMTAEKTLEVRSQLTVTRINMMSFSWIGYLWLMVQLPFAILSVITLGIVGAIDSLGGGGFFSWVIGGILEGVNAITSIFGVDFTKIALILFMVFQVIIMALGMICILIMYFQYIMGGINPIFGKSSSAKVGALILTIIGYCMPILNLFPFIFFWMSVVWWKPR